MSKLLIILMLFVIPFTLKAQIDSGLDSVFLRKSELRTATENNFNSPTVIPVSPEAAALGMYGSIPVGHYTGTANISIPLYEVDLDGKKIPISLSYHPSGIRVSQEASNVGLGWTLQLGGSIVKDVRGGDDFDNLLNYTQGYYFDTSYPSDDGMNNPKIEYVKDKYEIYKTYKQGLKDAEPDIFHFNFAGFSGSLFFQKINTGKNTKTHAYPICQKIAQNLSIEYDINKSVWVIVDGDGYQYYFNTKEKTTFFTYVDPPSLLNAEFLPKDGQLFQARYPQPEVITAWYLDSIVSPKNNKLTIHYEKDGVSTLINTSESVYHLLHYTINPKIGPMDFIPGYSTPKYSYSYGEIDQARPYKITTNNLTIELKNESRKDLEPSTRIQATSGTLNKPQRITEVLIYNNNSDLVKKYKLSQSYSGDVSSFKTSRLRLDEVVEYSATNVQGLKYKFSYNSVILPNKYSNMHDDWGYYNGQRASSNVFGETPNWGSQFITHIPEAKVKDQYGRLKEFKGRNKKVVEQYTKAESLETITYPTGGVTRFEYEPHALSYEDKTTMETERVYLAKVHTRNYEPDPEDYPEDSPPENPVYKQDFELESQTDLTFSYWFSIAKKNENIYDDTQAYDCIRITQGGKLIKSFSFGGGAGYGYHDIMIEKLPKGKYALEIVQGCVFSPHDFSLSSTVSYNAVKNGSSNKSLGGGLRIKAISYEEEGKTIKKLSYSYPNAILMAYPEFHKQSSTSFDYNTGVTIYDSQTGGYRYYDVFYDINYKFLESKSNPITPFSSSANGNPLGYNWALETTEQINAEGKLTRLKKEKYYYMCVSDEIDNDFPYSENSFLDGLRGNPFLGNGLLVRKEIYNEIDMQSQTEYEYEEINYPNSSAKGFVMDQIPFVLDDDQKYYKKLNVKYYDLFSSYWSLKKESTTRFVGDDTFAGVDNTEYTYNQTNFLPSSIIEKNSKGQRTETKLKYAFESSDKMASAMRSKNMVNVISEQIDLIDNKVSTGNKINYSLFNGNMILPTEYSILALDVPTSEQTYSGAYNKEFTITQYDKKGNIVEIQEKDGSYTSYLWSYNYQYPIIEIKHCRYSSLEAAIRVTTTGNVDNIATRPYLSHSTVKEIADNVKGLLTGYMSYFSYKAGVGILTATDLRGITTYYSYDSLGRLKETYIIDNGIKKILKAYDYNYLNK